MQLYLDPAHRHIATGFEPSHAISFRDGFGKVEFVTTDNVIFATKCAGTDEQKLVCTQLFLRKPFQCAVRRTLGLKTEF